MHAIRKYFGVAVLICLIGHVCQTRICFSAVEVEGKVNINTATEDQITLLPGIGSKLAAEIVNHRATSGNFKTIDDLKKISGVGDKKFEKIKDFIVVDGDTTIKSTKVAKGEKKTRQEK
ncbi:MAG: helix-hairpin-helix domain-containing protein [Candidatus Brocadia sp.]|nr:helix-hairpin-helix domain-containing protein [Candidatus Brocadia sp.]